MGQIVMPRASRERLRWHMLGRVIVFGTDIYALSLWARPCAVPEPTP
ncbi:hypothetical protein EHYA_07548 [Embleya hyalina]|uniref:Uncharacterized protein n=1 Tax=Embleya hyalina TaxID=516124 RepID=A0A401YYX9_9ACTN|nr:hypothetical protein EHYA_07548 [Embleya hyalina]